MKQFEFEIGDKIKVLHLFDKELIDTDLKIGDTGKIVGRFKNNYLIEFDRPIKVDKNCKFMTDCGYKMTPRQIEKMSTFKIGDNVTIESIEHVYLRYTEWVEHYVDDIELKWSFDFDHAPSGAHKHRIVAIGKHLYDDCELAYVKDLFTNRCYVIDIEGLSAWI